MLLWLTCVRVSVQSSARPIRSEERILQYGRAAGPAGRIRLQRGGPIHRRFRAALSRRAFPTRPATGFGGFAAAAATFSRRGGRARLGELKLLLFLGLCKYKTEKKLKKLKVILKKICWCTVGIPVQHFRILASCFYLVKDFLTVGTFFYLQSEMCGGASIPRNPGTV